MISRRRRISAACSIFTCTAVSFAHGGNDGQKGMGLIMLILIGIAPTAYALNRTMPDSSTTAFIQQSVAAHQVFARMPKAHPRRPEGRVESADRSAAHP